MAVGLLTRGLARKVQCTRSMGSRHAGVVCEVRARDDAAGWYSCACARHKRRSDATAAGRRNTHADASVYGSGAGHGLLACEWLMVLTAAAHARVSASAWGSHREAHALVGGRCALAQGSTSTSLLGDSSSGAAYAACCGCARANPFPTLGGNGLGSRQARWVRELSGLCSPWWAGSPSSERMCVFRPLLTWVRNLRPVAVLVAVGVDTLPAVIIYKEERCVGCSCWWGCCSRGVGVGRRWRPRMAAVGMAASRSRRR